MKDGIVAYKTLQICKVLKILVFKNIYIYLNVLTLKMNRMKKFTE